MTLLLILNIVAYLGFAYFLSDVHQYDADTMNDEGNLTSAPAMALAMALLNSLGLFW